MNVRIRLLRDNGEWILRVELEVDQPIFEPKEATHFVYMYVSPLITWAVVAAQR